MKQPSISQFFEKTLGANLANSRWSWGAVNPTTHQVFLRVWEDQIKELGGAQCVSIMKHEWEGASAGYPERIKHVEALRGGAEGYGVVCQAKNPQELMGRGIASYDGKELLRLGPLIQQGKVVFATIAGRVPVDGIARKQTAASTLLPDLRRILNAKADPTTKETLATARVGQGAFRAHVLATWDQRCCVTGAATTEAIRASHIKPWRDCTDQERLDPANGLPLVATLDALFDAGLVTFGSDGHWIYASALGAEERQSLGIDGVGLRKPPPPRTAAYLAYHRDHVFLGIT